MYSEKKLENIYPTFPKSTGPNSIPIPILKSNIEQVIDQITSIWNKSLAEGTFPDLLKLALKCANYRPISLLSNLSKIFERTMYNRIELFLSEFNTIYRLQFGVRKNTFYGTCPFKHNRRNQNQIWFLMGSLH